MKDFNIRDAALVLHKEKRRSFIAGMIVMMVIDYAIVRGQHEGIIKIKRSTKKTEK